MRSAAAKDKEREYLIELAKQLLPHYPHLFASLGDNGVIGALQTVSRRIASNMRPSAEHVELRPSESINPAPFVLKQRTRPMATKAGSSLNTPLTAEYSVYDRRARSFFWMLSKWLKGPTIRKRKTQSTM